MRLDSRELDSLEPVEIFDHLLFLRTLQCENIPFREFVRVVSQCFIDAFSLNSVEFCYVPVEQDFLTADFDDSGHHIVGGEWY